MHFFCIEGFEYKTTSRSCVLYNDDGLELVDEENRQSKDYISCIEESLEAGVPRDSGIEFGYYEGALKANYWVYTIDIIVFHSKFYLRF